MERRLKMNKVLSPIKENSLTLVEINVVGITNPAKRAREIALTKNMTFFCFVFL